MRTHRVVRRLRLFIGQENGSATIEALFWIPLFFFVLILAVDVTLISTAQSRVMRIVQDGNRAYALGRLADAKATQDFIQEAIRPISARAEVASQVNSLTKVIVSTVSMPASDLSKIGWLPDFDSLTITVSAQQVKEF